MRTADSPEDRQTTGNQGMAPSVDDSVALQLDSVTKRFGALEAVSRVELSVRQGEFLTLLGPSGSGKTTILRVIAGFEAPTEGRVLLDGRDISALSPSERGIGVVFQNYALFPHMTVAQNVCYPLKMRRWSRSRMRERLDEVLELVRLPDYAGRYPRQLSGGQQQRVALARCLAFHPALLLMDEPLGALDQALRIEMQEELRRIHRESGTTIIFVTHDQEEALAMSDRIGVMRNGSVLQFGTPRDLYAKPIDSFVASFFGDCALLPVRVLEEQEGKARIEVMGREDWIEVGAPLSGRRPLLVLRPGRVRLKPQPEHIEIPVRVVDMLYLGETVRITMHNDDVQSLTARVGASEAQALEPGMSLTVGFDPDDAVVVPEYHAEHESP